MFSQSDIVSVYQFLKDTPEGPLRKMMVGSEMSDAHFRVFLKVIRSCSESDFVQAFNDESIPRVRLTPAEYALKENLWPIAKKKLEGLGLLNSQKAAA